MCVFYKLDELFVRKLESRGSRSYILIFLLLTTMVGGVSLILIAAVFTNNYCSIIFLLSHRFLLLLLMIEVRMVDALDVLLGLSLFLLLRHLINLVLYNHIRVVPVWLLLLLVQIFKAKLGVQLIFLRRVLISSTVDTAFQRGEEIVHQHTLTMSDWYSCLVEVLLQSLLLLRDDFGSWGEFLLFLYVYLKVWSRFRSRWHLY
jgi:hypothetical protein